MTDSLPGFVNLQMLNESWYLVREGGRPVVLLRGFSFRAAGRDQRLDMAPAASDHIASV